MEQGGIIECDRLAKRIAEPVGCRNGFGRVTVCIVSLFEKPREMREIGIAKDTQVRPGEER